MPHFQPFERDIRLLTKYMYIACSRKVKSHLMRLWYFSSSVYSFFKHAFSGDRCLNFGRTLRLLPFAWVFAGRLCDKYHNLMSLYTSQMFQKATYFLSIFLKTENNLAFLFTSPNRQMSLFTKTSYGFRKLFNSTVRARRWTQVPPFLKFAKFSILTQFMKHHRLK